MALPNVWIDGDWRDLRRRASDVKHSTGFFIEEKADGKPAPSGDLRASVTLTCPGDYQAQWLARGKLFRFYDYGTLRWGGVISEVERGTDGITIHAEGIGSVLKDWSALDDPGTGEVATFIPNDAVDYAESQGAPFSRFGADLGSTAIMLSDSGELVTDMLTLLTRAAISQGKRLRVASNGAITFKATPTVPSWMMTPQSDYFSTADDQFVTTLRGEYLSLHYTVFRVTVTGSPSGGTFTLSGNGTTTAAINHNALSAAVQTQVRALGGVFSNADVSLMGIGDWLVETTLGDGDLGVGNNSLSGGTNPGISITKDHGHRMVKAEDTDAAEKFGVRQVTIDMTNLGPITDAAAQAYIDGRFALIGGRMGWTTQVELTTKNLMYINGCWASPANVRAGEMLMIPGIIDSRSSATTRGSIQWVAQQVEITEGDKPTAVVTPVGFVLRDYDGAIATPENPSTKEAA